MCVCLTHRSRRCLYCKCYAFAVMRLVVWVSWNVIDGLVACGRVPTYWWTGHKLVTRLLMIWLLFSGFVSISLQQQYITHCAPPNVRMIHHVSLFFSGSTPQAELGCSMMPFIIWRRWDNPSSSEKLRRGSHRRWDNPSSGDSTLWSWPMQWRQLDLVAVVPRCCSNAPFLLEWAVFRWACYYGHELALTVLCLATLHQTLHAPFSLLLMIAHTYIDRFWRIYQGHRDREKIVLVCISWDNACRCSRGCPNGTRSWRTSWSVGVVPQSLL